MRLKVTKRKSNLNQIEWTTGASKRPKDIATKSKIEQKERPKGQNGNESTLSFDIEYGGLDAPIMRTPEAKKMLTTAREKL